MRRAFSLACARSWDQGLDPVFCGPNPADRICGFGPHEPFAHKPRTSSHCRCASAEMVFGFGLGLVTASCGPQIRSEHSHRMRPNILR